MLRGVECSSPSGMSLRRLEPQGSDRWPRVRHPLEAVEEVSTGAPVQQTLHPSLSGGYKWSPAAIVPSSGRSQQQDTQRSPHDSGAVRGLRLLNVDEVERHVADWRHSHSHSRLLEFSTSGYYEFSQLVDIWLQSPPQPSIGMHLSKM